jgi:FkbM family methyltransferase
MTGEGTPTDRRSEIRKKAGRLRARLRARLLESSRAVGFNPYYLSRICRPATVIDVGVGYGTWPLHKAYPASRFILVEPLTEYRPHIARLEQAYDCTVLYTAVGERAGTLEINIDGASPMKSSFSRRVASGGGDTTVARRSVPVVTLDSLVEALPDLQRPILLKIDTEGHELSVLRGATTLLPTVDTVIAEVSIAMRFEDGYEFEELIEFMRESGFYVYSFLTMPFPRRSDRQRFTDIVFKNRRLAPLDGRP